MSLLLLLFSTVERLTLLFTVLNTSLTDVKKKLSDLQTKEDLHAARAEEREQLRACIYLAWQIFPKPKVFEDSLFNMVNISLLVFPS